MLIVLVIYLPKKSGGILITRLWQHDLYLSLPYLVDTPESRCVVDGDSSKETTELCPLNYP